MPITVAFIWACAAVFVVGVILTVPAFLRSRSKGWIVLAVTLGAAGVGVGLIYYWGIVEGHLTSTPVPQNLDR